MPSNNLFESISLGLMRLPNRVVMAPMTRARTAQPGDIPSIEMATYYAQRASAGLIITEATQISQQGQGYSFTPGIYSEAQVQGWRRVTQEVHDAGGRIVLQLWHVGRMSHPSFHTDGMPVAPSALAPNAQVWVVGSDGIGRMLECPVPRALSAIDIQNVIADFRHGAANAMRAGFDGVEIHGGNGYLIDQFLRTTSNHRTDEYGGTLENRIRFACDVASAVVTEIGAARTGIRIAPFITQRNMNCPDIITATLALAERLEAMQVAYIHLAEADWDDAPQIDDGFRQKLRQTYQGKIMVAGNYSAARAEAILAGGLVDLVAFGRPFIANPDLPKRFMLNAPLAEFDPSTLFGGNAQGYIDYPSLS
ncbi:alkene reductase [Polynucleobacter sp. es-MAR-4]|uniref:alkene reductase n=1 Tax=Polynucleobacter sp. es-MAR-4 TaxID=1855655 RepID=UPI001C0B89B5|nr:alkene reductase [Polynucleobacter sp. es-MAR-4]MBU3636065.1 alkene reductase [Polynucleobacter sp. es-MAR-4]